MLSGTVAGTVGGAVLAGRRGFSFGDASVMRNAGVLGVLVSEMVVDWFHPEDNAYITAAMVGGLVGLAGGDRLVADTEFTVSQSVLVTLGLVAGGALGLGVGYISSSNDNGTLLLTSSAIGATIGFAGTYASFRNTARARRVGQSFLRLELSPLAAMAAAGRAPATLADAPLLRLSARF